MRNILPFAHSVAMNRHLFSRPLTFAALLTMLLCTPVAALPETAAPLRPIQIELSLPLALSVYPRAAVLPLRCTDNTADPQLTEVLFQELDKTQKYELIAPAPAVKAPPPLHNLDNLNANLQANAAAYGREARVRAVVSGVIVAGAGALDQTQSDKPKQAPALIVAMTDTARDKPIWRLTLTPPFNDAEQRPAREQLQDLLREGVEELIVHLVNQGDVYTTRLPKPRVLSREARQGFAHVLVQPERRSLIAAYQLLRAPSPDGPFLPAGEPATNRRSPLALEEEQTEDTTAAWYTVIGLTASGLATLPAPPFQVAVAPAAAEP